MIEFLLIIAAILVWLCGWQMGRESLFRLEDDRLKKEQELAKESKQ